MRTRTRGWLWAAAAVAFAVIVLLVARSPVPDQLADATTATLVGGAQAATAPAASTSADIRSQCPWLRRAMDRHESPAALAQLVVGRMHLSEKLGEIVLARVGTYENINSGVPRLCIPALTLQDGPQGLAFGDTGVTQLPAPLGIAATFDPTVARAYGEVQGSEAAGQGIDVVQGPNLNILRIPQNGRAYEGFGEDPLLVTAMGVANIEGIQSTGVMAQAKHFAVYNQETDRGPLNDVVSDRALNELYLPPFQAAVIQAHVASVMCAYPRLNGTYQCQDAAVLALLDQWGFTGFVRSDLGAVHDPAAAVTAGTDLLKPAIANRLETSVHDGLLSVTAVDRAVTRMLTPMFSYGLIGRSAVGAPGTPVASADHAAFALRAAERSAVLLKDDRAVLPLHAVQSVAVIGADASTLPVTTGFGSSAVTPPFTSSPLAAIRQRAGVRTSVSYSDGGSTTGELPAIPTDVLTPAAGTGHGLTLNLTETDPDARSASLQTVQPTVDTTIRPSSPLGNLLIGPTASTSPDRTRKGLSLTRSGQPVSRPNITRSRIVLPAGWTDVKAAWNGTLTPPKTGLYTFSLQGSGGASLLLDGVPAVSDMLSHAHGRWSQTVTLTGGRAYRMQVNWEPFDALTPSGESTVTPGVLTLGWKYVSDPIADAVAAARRADVAVVFAGDFNAESFDRPSLSLPGDENALITAVAAANPRTVVVLNTGGPVLMPWASSVAGVVEAWYPGEQDGAAIAAVLFGDVDPAGHLPVTFPVSDAQSAVAIPAQWPGVNLVSDYSEGLQVGYRFDHAGGIQPLFPFGYGLSYTRFALSRLAIRASAQGYMLTVDVTNTGARAGTVVPQAYLTDPPAAGEPPAQLVAFSPVAVEPGQTRTVALSVPATAFRAFLNGAWSVVPGVYTFSVGQSSADLPLTATVTAP